MYAIKKHINKVLAVFLCACLLLSYNPAFGAVDNAWAADGDETTASKLQGSQVETDPDKLPEGMQDPVGRDVTLESNGRGGYTGDASTEVHVSTFNSELRTAGADDVFARVQDIIDADLTLRVEATYADGTNADAYDFTWSIENASLSKDALDTLNKNIADFVQKTKFDSRDRKVAYSVFELSAFFEAYGDPKDKNAYLKNAQDYTFNCVVTANKIAVSEKNPAKESIHVYTFDKSDIEKNYYLERLVNEYTNEDGDKVIRAVTRGQFLGSASLAAELSADADKVEGAFANEANGWTEEEQKNQYGETITYVPGTPAQIAVNGSFMLGEEEKPAFFGDGYTIYLPIDPEYLYDEDNNRRGLDEDDPITVMWKGRNNEGGIKTFTATVTKEPGSGQLMAAFYYDATAAQCLGYTDADGNQSTQTAGSGWTEYKPGFFSLLLSSENHTPNSHSPAYFKVSVNVAGGENGGGRFILAGNSVWSAEQVYPTGTEGVTKTYGFDIIPDDPQLADGTRSVLTHLWYWKDDDTNRQNLLGSTIPRGLKLDLAASHVTITKPLTDWDAYDTTYHFEAVFDKSHKTIGKPDNTDTQKLGLRVVDESGNPSSLGVIEATYQNGSGADGLDYVTASTSGQRDNKCDLTVLYTGQAKLQFYPHAAIWEDGKAVDYEIKRVETSTDGYSWTTAASYGGKLNIPSMESDMLVRAVVGVAEHAQTVHFYNVTVTPDKNGTVSPAKGYIGFGVSTSTSFTFTATGNDEEYYPAKAIARISNREGSSTREYTFWDKGDRSKTTTSITYSIDADDPEPTSDIEILVEFAPVAGTSYELWVQAGSGGSATPLGGKTLTNRRMEALGGSALSFRVVANPGKQVSKITIGETGESVRTEITSQFVGGVLDFTMPEANSTLIVEFEDVAPALKPGEGNRNVNVYVADEGLKAAGSKTAYIWDRVDGNEVLGAPYGAVVPVGASDRSIALTGQSESHGLVNSRMYYPTSIARASNYTLNFKGAEIEDKTGNYVVKKVLVIAYDEGEAGKTISSMTLYNYSRPTSTFVLGAANDDVDIIVFFSEPTAADSGYGSLGSWNVKVSNDGKLSTNWAPGTNSIAVTTNSYVTLSGLVASDPDYELDPENCYATGFTVSESDWEDVASTGILEVGPVASTVNIYLAFKEKDGGEGPNPPNPPVVTGAAVYARDLNSTTTAVDPANGNVTLTQNGRDHTVYYNYSPNIAEGSFTIGFAPAPTYALKQVKFTNSSDVAAYWKKNVDGYNLLQIGGDEPDGYENFAWDTLIVPGENDATAWRVTGLTSELTVWPEFVKDDNSGNTTDEYRVRAHVVDGEGAITLSYDNGTYSNEVYVPKSATGKSVVVNFTPAKGYKVGSVKVERWDGNIFKDLWDSLWSGSAIAGLVTSGIQANQIVLSAPVNFNYDIRVAFEKIDPNMVTDGTVPINVFSNQGQGTVKPSTNVRAKKTDTPEFSVYTKPYQTNPEYFYVVDEVKVTRYYTITGSNGTEELSVSSAVPTTAGVNNQFVTWVNDSKDIFTLNMSRLDSESSYKLTAVDVEVTYKQGEATGGTPTGDLKNVTVVLKSGSGTVYPEGEYPLYAYQVSGKWAEFPVVVSPANNSTLKSIKVYQKSGASWAESADLATSYTRQVKGETSTASGCFYIQAVPGESMTDELIEIEFASMSQSDSTYKINTSVAPREGTDGTLDGNVAPKEVEVPNAMSYSITASPKNKYKVGEIEDYYTVGGVRVPVPASAKAKLSEDTGYIITVTPYVNDGETVDREIIVHFVRDENAVKIPDDQKGSISVTVYGVSEASQIVKVSPNKNLVNIYVGPGAHHAYSFDITPANQALGYYMYAVKMNGDWVYNPKGVATSKDDLIKNGHYTAMFGSGSGEVRLKNNSQGANTIEVYVGNFPGGNVSTGGGNGSLITGGGPGGLVFDENGAIVSGRSMSNIYSSVNRYGAEIEDADPPDDDDENNQGSGDENGDGNETGGNQTTGGDQSGNEQTGGEQTSGDVTTGGETGEGSDITFVPDVPGDGTGGTTGHEVLTRNITPQWGYVIDHVYLDNVTIVEGGYTWMTPEEFAEQNPAMSALVDNYGASKNKKIFLQYKLHLTDPTKDGHVWPVFKAVPLDQIISQGPGFPQTGELGSDNLRIQISPKEYGEPLAKLFALNGYESIKANLPEGLTAQEGTVAAYPSVAEPSWTDNAYTITYSTKKNLTGDTEFEFEIGPLVKWNTANPSSSTIYAIDTAALKRMAPNATVTPVIPSNVTPQETKFPTYYQRYIIKGTANDFGFSTSRAGTVTVPVPVTTAAMSQSALPEYNWYPQELVQTSGYKVTVTAGDNGAIEPVSINSGNANWWSDSLGASSWSVARGMTVSFKLKPQDGYVYTGVFTRDGLRLSGVYQNGDIISFTANSDLDVVVRFSKEVETRKVNISVLSNTDGVYTGTTDPEPGSHPVPKGEPYTITLIPADGYKPYGYWVNGRLQAAVESYQITVPAADEDQTVQVRFASKNAAATEAGYPYTGDLAQDVRTGLVATGDNPIALACIAGVAVLAVVGVWQMRRRKASAARAAKYSVTKRK